MEHLSDTRQSHAISWIGFYGLILGAWASVFLMTLDLPPSAVVNSYGLSFWNALCGGAADTDLPALLGMWVLMSAAMMAPTLIPVLKVYDDLAHCSAADGHGFIALATGFLGVWLIFSMVGAYAQLALAEYELVAPDGSSRSLWLTAVLLCLAGLYQFSAVKNACLTRCRHPLAFFLEYWRPGPSAALLMGARLGALCLGCCWALMALGFVGGTMNLLWMGAATLFMTLEKLPDIGRYLTRPAAWILLVAGVAMVTRAIRLI